MHRKIVNSLMGYHFANREVMKKNTDHYIINRKLVVHFPRPKSNSTKKGPCITFAIDDTGVCAVRSGCSVYIVFHLWYLLSCKWEKYDFYSVGFLGLDEATVKKEL